MKQVLAPGNGRSGTGRVATTTGEQETILRHGGVRSFQVFTEELLIWLEHKETYTPGTAGGPGGRDRTLAVKS